MGSTTSHSAPQEEVPAQLVALEELVTKVNGFVYQGDRLNAVVDTLRVLRENPELAHILLKGGKCE